MNWRITLMASLGANVVLAAFVTKQWWVHRVADVAVVRPALVATPALAPAPASVPLNPAATNTTLLPFHWRYVESTDYVQYVANLRAIDCPEHVIRDVVLADLNPLYEAQAGRGAPRPAPWVGSAQRRELETRRQDRERRLEAERRSVIRELLGAEWSADVIKAWYEEPLFAMVAGFLPAEKAILGGGLVERIGQEAERVKREAEGLFLPADLAKLDALRQQLETELAGILDPGEMEEALLRTQAAVLFFGDGDLHFDGMELTPTQLRELVRASRVLKDMMRDVAFGPDQPVDDAEKARRQARFENLARGVLGEARFADYVRAQDETFRDALNVTRAFDLPVDAAARVSETRRAAERERAGVLADPVLADDEKQAALEVIRRLTRQQVLAALGARAAEEYWRRDSSWLDNVAQLPASAAPLEARP